MENKPKILIVEDDVLTIEVYKSIFENEYELSVAWDGKSALESIKEVQPDLVLLDVMLPDYNGMDLCEKFKNDKSLQHIPIIIVSTLDTPADKMEALKVGANDFINKPFDETELLLKVKNHLTILEQYHEIKRQNREINRYVEVIVHDLKNPLAVIIGYTDLIDTFTKEEAIKKYNGRMVKTAQKMLDSINRLLDIQRIKNSNFNIRLENFDITQRLEEILGEWKALATQKGVTIKLEAKPGIPHVIGDREKIKSILDNLIDNALKFSPADSVVTVTSEENDDGFVKITLKDQGPGLSTEEVKKIFEEYRGLSEKNVGARLNSGLGLPIVKRLVELMGGEVGVESWDTQKGAAFWFTLKKKEGDAL